MDPKGNYKDVKSFKSKIRCEKVGVVEKFTDQKIDVKNFKSKTGRKNLLGKKS